MRLYLKLTDGQNLFIDFLACALIILSHFLNYVTYLRYYLIWPDLLLVVLFLVCFAFSIALLQKLTPSFVRILLFAILVTIVAGDAIFQLGISGGLARLIASFVVLIIAFGVLFFLKQHTAKVLIGGFAAMTAATLVLAIQWGPAGRSDDAPKISAKPLPVILHIVLDEHMGLAGMTNDVPGGSRLRQDVESFYHGNGFRLFARAYSQYFDTAPSLASTLNFDEANAPFRYLKRERDKWSLDKIRYFQKMSERGYKIQVYQSSYIDFCQSGFVDRCFSYHHDVFSLKAVAGLSLVQRVKLIFKMYFSSIALLRLAQLAEEPTGRFFQEHGLRYESGWLWHGRIGPLAVEPALSALERDLSKGQGGMLFFAHLLLPHYPYLYDAKCKIRTPINEWGMRTLSDGSNTVHSRRRHYSQYLQQIRCTLLKIGSVLRVMDRAGTLRNALIIIHSDHGSRINVLEPTVRNVRSLTPRDFKDGFSALFAVKRPGIRAGTDQRLVTLTQLLRYSVSGSYKLEPTESPFVNLQVNEMSYEKHPFSILDKEPSTVPRALSNP